MNNKSKDVIEWVVTAALIFVIWPIGLFLLFLKLKKSNEQDKKSNTTYSSVKKSDNSVYGSVKQTTYQRSTYSTARNTAQKKTSAPQKTNSKPSTQPVNRQKPKSTAAIILLIASIVLLIDGCKSLFDYLSFNALFIEDAVRAAFYLLGGGASLFASIFLHRKTKRYLKYLNVMGVDDAKSVQEIATATGFSQMRVRKDLDYMANRGYFGPEAYFDVGLDSIVISQEAAENERNIRYAQEVVNAPKEAPSTDKYDKAIDRLRDLNNSIKDESISAKAAKIEVLAEKILKIARENPEKESEIRKFYEYYLPSTEKLLRSYSVLEKQGISGSNITTTRAEIERILDTLIVGYEKQLDNLFGSDAIDISSDIDVLETMLKQDGLTGETLGGH